MEPQLKHNLECIFCSIQLIPETLTCFLVLGTGNDLTARILFGSGYTSPLPST